MLKAKAIWGHTCIAGGLFVWDTRKNNRRRAPVAKHLSLLVRRQILS